MVKDVVCGMQVDEGMAGGKSEHRGKTYYFCSNGCKERFDRDQEKYAAKTEEQKDSQQES